jgi:formylmethanofuran dehydrogenase subunit C
VTALTFALRGEPDQRLDLSALTPGRLAGLSVVEITALPVHTTKIKATVGDHFRVSGDDVSQIRFAGGSSRLDGIGTEMSSGSILVDGDAGSRVGRLMSAGSLAVRGSTGPWAGSGMKGGKIDVAKNAGDWLGGPLAGELSGMRGGIVSIGGSAGREAAHRLRRGLIVISGDAGDFAGRAMIAGTLVIGGKAGAYPGYLMRRGTIVLRRMPKQLSPTFQDCGTCDLAFLRLLERTLATEATQLRMRIRPPVRRFAGDLAVLGKAELFVASA